MVGQPQIIAELLHGQAHALQKGSADGAGQAADDRQRNGQHQASREGSGQAAGMDAARSAACGGSISVAANVTPVRSMPTAAPMRLLRSKCKSHAISCLDYRACSTSCHIVRADYLMVLQMAVPHPQEGASNAAPAAIAGNAAQRWGGAFPAFSVRQQGRPAVPQPLRPAMMAAVERRAISVDSDETDLSDDDRDGDDGHQQSVDRTPGAGAASVNPPRATAEAAGEAPGVEHQDAAQGKPPGRKTLAETVKQIQEERQPSSGQLQGFPSSNSDADVGSGCVQASGTEGAPRPEERR